MDVFKKASNLVGYNNPAEAASQNINRIPEQTYGYNEPFYNTGVSNLQPLNNIYSGMANDPGGFYNETRQRFNENVANQPSYLAARQRMLDNADETSNASGLWNTPAHKENRYRSGNLFDEDRFNNYLSQQLDIQGRGVGGLHRLANEGQRAGEAQVTHKGNVEAANANLNYKSGQNYNEFGSKFFQEALQLAALAAGGYFGYIDPSTAFSAAAGLKLKDFGGGQ